MERSMKTARTERGALQAAVVARAKALWPTGLTNTSDPAVLQHELLSHYGPHPNAKIEWWYLNGHLQNGSLAFFAAFFRLAVPEHTLVSSERCAAVDSGVMRLHAVNWALIDTASGHYRAVSKAEPHSPEVLLSMMSMRRAPPARDAPQEPGAFLDVALRELLASGTLPLPDELAQEPADVLVHPDGSMKMALGGCTLQWDAVEGVHKLHLEGNDDRLPASSGRRGVTLDLIVESLKAPVLHGRDGVVSTIGEWNDMFYYFLPKCLAKGTVEIDGAVSDVHGDAWIDHEFGGGICETVEELRACPDQEASWQWAAVQLDNDVEASLTLVVTPAGDKQLFAVIREGERPAVRVDDVSFGPDESAAAWTSPVSGLTFPLRWHARIVHPDDGAVSTLRLDASMPHQEFITVAAAPSFWEGHARCSGTWRGNTTVTGNAFVEVRGPQHDSGGVAAYFDIMHAAITVPGIANLRSLKPADREAALDAATRHVRTAIAAVSLAAPMPVTAAVDRAIAATVAALYSATLGDDSQDPSLQRLEKMWSDELAHSIPHDLTRLALRAWMLWEVRHARQTTTAAPPPLVEKDNATTPEAAAVAARSVFDLDSPFVVAGEEELSVAASPAVVEVARAVFTCRCSMIRNESESLSGMLSAQGVLFVVRQLTDRLVPTLNIQVTDVAIVTAIKTVVSQQTVETRIDGSPTKWFSAGRGDLVTRACLQDGGRTLYMRTAVPPDSPLAIEHKWFRALPGPDSGTARIVEHYRYDPHGVEGADSIRVRRVFKIIP